MRAAGETVLLAIDHFRNAAAAKWLPAILFLLTALAGCSDDQPVSAEHAPGELRRPNMLLIVADDMGYTDLGSFGSEIRTPHLDKLAYGGVRLTNFHVHPSCAPTRAALMSGTLPHVAGVGTQLVTIERFRGHPLVEARRAKPGYEGYLNDRVAPIPALLQNAGYRTYMTGKWHLGEAPEQSPAARGFNRSFELIHGSGSHFPNTPTHLYREDGEAVGTLPKDFYSTAYYTDKMISYIEESREDGDPWFGYLAYTSPHWPLQVPDEWLERYAGNYSEGYDRIRRQRMERAHKAGVISARAMENPALPFARPWAGLEEEERLRYARAMEIYAAMVENLDHHAGRIIQYLVDTGQLDNTVVVFMSDNGAEDFDFDYVDRAPRKPDSINNAVENFGRPDSFILYGPGWAQAGMGPFSLHKGTLGEGGLRAAAFVNYHSVVRKGGTDNTFLTVRDLSATLLEIAGVQHPGTKHQGREIAPLEGDSFLSLLTVEGASLARKDKTFVWELDGQVALVRDNWKYSRLETPHREIKAEPGWRLYNLIDDPGETRNLSGDHPELVSQFNDAWERVASSGEMIIYPDPEQGWLTQP